MRELIRASFLGPGISPDPAGDGSGWERGQIVVPEEKLVRAAVLVPLIDRPEGMTVLLTRRTDAIRHAGQVCLPGGRSLGHHETPEETALREAEEEVGLTRDRVELVGRLNVRHTGTGYKVTPVVGLIAPPMTLRPDPSEVADIFEVPLANILDTANHRLEVQLRDGREREFYVVAHSEHYIWGVTARVLVDLQQVLAEAFARR